LDHAAESLGKFLIRSHFSRERREEIEQFFGDGCAESFQFANHLHEELRPLGVHGPKSERDWAFDVWIWLGVWWMQGSKRFHTLAWLSLYGFMCACGAPLLPDYKNAVKVRKRTMKKVGKALARDSEMSAGWRQNWLERFPLTATALTWFKPLRVRRQRLAHHNPGRIQSV
jgi:hypothetical protein